MILRVFMIFLNCVTKRISSTLYFLLIFYNEAQSFNRRRVFCRVFECIVSWQISISFNLIYWCSVYLLMWCLIFSLGAWGMHEIFEMQADFITSIRSYINNFWIPYLFSSLLFCYLVKVWMKLDLFSLTFYSKSMRYVRVNWSGSYFLLSIWLSQFLKCLFLFIKNLI